MSICANWKKIFRISSFTLALPFVTFFPNAQAANSSCDLTFPDHRLCATVTFKTAMPLPTNTDLEGYVALKDIDTGAPVEPTDANTFTVKFWMPSMPGMNVIAPKIDRAGPEGGSSTGIFHIYRIRFSMNGAWDLDLKLGNANATEKVTMKFDCKSGKCTLAR